MITGDPPRLESCSPTAGSPRGAGTRPIRVWHPSTGACGAVLGGHTSAVHALAVLPDGRLASGDCQGVIRVLS